MRTRLQTVLSHLNNCPRSLLPSLRAVKFVCPLCRGELDILTDPDGYSCPRCERAYLLHDGIPDFRVFPDPYLSFQEDHERTEIVISALESHDLESLLEYYWSFSDVTPEALRPKFIRSAMLGEQKARRLLQTLEDGTFRRPVAPRKVLEIGSGTGSFLALATQRYEQVIGIDIAMRWLHVSRRRFMDNGLPIPPLVCCCAEYLPFPDNSFDLAVMSATLEFVRDQERVFSECARMLKPNGALYINTVNRYAAAKDPYAYLWGVGFLPRAWQFKYVRWRRGALYQNIRTLSLRELNRMAKRYFATTEFALPDISSDMLRHFSSFTRFQVHVYQTLRALPPFSTLLKMIGPGWDAMFRK